ncbi:hypothetical protein M406DRAFT_93122 [Cryphonectria parasitica EP155]|uniref:Rab-GAP TBC domain-containing protein n=1 Tax=Cryphonectria parasitica (strain ATCC 38755 / EP155) TaxID=660469 RepID=A0A9P4XXE2_CRYP1|nr:uncharacterized protein M406DRAFT_93122 [Cryphonectria parasitica EP155]KAF3762763.1 hypothetical protein M406DRAFT_93122 [Cryphonectria parasitica EP155]
MMLYERPVEQTIVLSDAGSPPGLSTSKSSKSSSFPSSRSFGSDRESVITDVSNFEDIGLQDDAPSQDHDVHQPKRDPSPFARSYASDLRAAKSLTNLKAQPQPQQQQQQPPIRPLSKSRTLQVTQREIYNPMRRRSNSPNLQTERRDPHVRNASTNQLVSESLNPLPLRTQSNRTPNSRPSVPSFSRRHRTPSPNLAPSLSLATRGPALSLQLRRSSWQSNRERKSEAELEKECDEDDGDDIPEGFVLDNVPLSPRPVSERTKSQPSSKTASPERPAKGTRIRSVGNGTPAVAAAHGSIGELRSPGARSDATFASLRSPDGSTATSPIKRANSWNATLAELNKDAQELTEKLEEHAEELATKSQRSSTGSIPKARRHSDESKSKHKSALAELPPLRRTNIMIDPLPISKEKEAVLSRTRPSWLPPKDPAEERRHLKEYQKMMARSQENERRREEKKKAMSSNKDQAADSLMQIWEKDIVPRWNDAIRERRTRELWWMGVAPRSRGAVWTKAIGNDLGLTDKSFQAALGRAHSADAREKAGHGSPEDHKYTGWMRAIRKDVEEHTWQDLRIFQAGGPLHQSLLDVLSAYAMYRSDIGYVTGSNTIAALLLLNTPTPAAAFVALANILNRALPLSFHSDDAGAKSSAYNLLLQTLAAKSRDLHDHLTKLPEHDLDLYMGEIFSSLFTSQLALDEASRLWDVYIFEGDAVLIRAGVAVLLDHEMALLGTKSVGEVQKVIRSKKHRLVGKPGDEDRWMKAVREAGKNNS